MLKRKLVDLALVLVAMAAAVAVDRSLRAQMSWQKGFELAYTALVGFEIGYILDLIRQLR